MERPGHDAEADPLTAADAGGRAIRGGVLRVSGYVAGLALTAGASVLLLRYLVPADFGQYFVVLSLIAIVAGLSDAGLTAVGQREYVLRATPVERRAFLGDLLGLRLAVTPIAVALAVGFAVLAGYSGAQIAGTAIAGAGVVFINAAATATTPLATSLRLGAVTATELIRQLVLVLGLVVCIVAAASLETFFWSYAASGVAMLVAAVALVGRADLPRPTFDRARWAAIGRQAAPVAVGLVINVLYLRLLAIMTSLLSTDEQTGLFGTSYRVLEIFIGIPAIMAGAAFPILAHAAKADEARLAFVLQRLAETSLLVAGGAALGLAIAAEPVVAVLGGAEYADAAPVLSLQAVALLGAFLTQVWVLGLVATHRQLSLVVVNGIGVGVVIVLGLLLIPGSGAQGAALASVLGELALAGSAIALLSRGRPALRPSLGRPLRLLVAGAAGAACALLGLPAIVEAVLAVLVYGGVAFALKAVPLELIGALRPNRTSEPATGATV